MAQLTKKQTTKIIYRLAKTLAEICNEKLATTKTEIEMQLNDCNSSVLLYISKYDGKVMSIKPMYESEYMKIKVFYVKNDEYIIVTK